MFYFLIKLCINYRSDGGFKELKLNSAKLTKAWTVNTYK